MKQITVYQGGILSLDIKKRKFYSELKLYGTTNSTIFGFLELKIVFAKMNVFLASQPAFNCSELTIKTLQQDVKYAQS